MKEKLKILPKALREKRRYVFYSLKKGGFREIKEKIRELSGEFGLENCDIREIEKGIVRCNLKGLNNVSTAILFLEGEIKKVSGSIKSGKKK